MRAVFDTNILISGLLWRGAAHECILAAEAGLIQLVLSEPILDELREKLIQKFGDDALSADQRLSYFRKYRIECPCWDKLAGSLLIQMTTRSSRQRFWQAHPMWFRETIISWNSIRSKE